MSKKYEWEIHGVVDDKMINGMCDAHSHGLAKYCGRELQVVLNHKDYMALINDVGEFCKDTGLKLYAGMMISGLFDDDAQLRIDDAVDDFGEPVWRLIIPDGEFKYPEESEEYPYYLQIIETKEIYNELN